MESVIGSSTVTQIAFIVRDVAETKKKFAEFLGVPEPPAVGSGEYEATRTVYKGNPAPEAACKMAFFNIGADVSIELIEPNEVPSVWRDFLEERGEGLHHIAFNVKGMDMKIKACEGFGMALSQRGKYGDRSGEYAYLDATKDLKCFIELLENYS
ncbi:MAG: VOC family protein [Defluviitaleaceae bacterium]|nr:VOC family protein [Defluviitaleaceae bacterium]MCL2836296.1 VOC family protein [Defluviitaleaceae bacterium]